MSQVSPLAEQASRPSGLGREMRGFALVGVAGLIVDAALTALFAQALGLSPFLARPPATFLAIGVTWWLNRSITFRSQDSGLFAEFLRYLLVSIGGAAVSYVFYAMALYLAAWSGAMSAPTTPFVLAAVALGSVPAMLFNFLGSRWFAFMKHSRQS